MQFCILLLYEYILALCTILHVLHSLFVPALQCICTCALSLHSVQCTSLFIHLAFSAFCVCIIRRHSRPIQHTCMLHSSSVAFKGPSAFICILCPLHLDMYALPYHFVAFNAVAFRHKRYALRCIQHMMHAHAF